MFKPWLFYVVILLSVVVVDYILRAKSVDFYQAGIREDVWFAVHFIAWGVFIYHLVAPLQRLSRPLLKLLFLAKQFSVAIATYVLIIYGYILGVGIDSL